MRGGLARAAAAAGAASRQAWPAAASHAWPQPRQQQLQQQQGRPRRRGAATWAAAAGAAAAAAGGDAAHPLVAWVRANGGAVNGVAPADLAGADGGSGWGLVATQAVEQPGARLIELPRRCQLTYDESSDPRLLALVAQVPDELWGAKLALQLLAQRVAGGGSAFAPYVAQLPVGVAGVPMFFARDALEAVEYPPVVEQVKRRGRWLHRFALDVLAKLPGTPADPFDGVAVDTNSLGWALAVVTSRAFRVAGPTAPAALLPLIDMANHSFQPNAEVLPVPGGVALVAKTKIPAGAPLLLSYGPLSNDFLLMDYGFVVPDNPHDRVALRFEPELVASAALIGGARDGAGQLLQVDASTPWRQQHLARLGLSGGGPKQNLQVVLGGPALVEPRLLAAVRGLVATYQSEVESLTLEVLGSWDRPLNKQNEAATLRVLIGVAMVALQNFSCGVDPDLAALQGRPPGGGGGGDGGGGGGGGAPAASLSPDMCLALSFRSQRKQLLVDVIAALADKLKQVPRIAGLKESPVVAARKGQKPRPASPKGFGKA
ncbi:SETD3 [Scenedesmus sp. PABB004]|nr:SETD3 [Scenedesmus sp. PABB004]